MSKSFFTNIIGFNETAMQNIQETEELFFELKYEDDYTKKETHRRRESFIPFEEDIITYT